MQTFFLICSLAYRNVWRNWRRSLLTISAVAIALWSCAVLSTLARGLSWGMAQDSIRTLTGHAQIQTRAYRDDPSIDNTFPAEALNHEAFSAPEIERWTTRLRLPAVATSERDSLGVTLVGIDPESERGLSFLPEAIIKGRYLESPEDPGIVVGERMLELLQTQIGKRIVVMSQSAEQEIAERGFRIVGIYRAKLRATEETYIFTGRTVAQQMVSAPHALSEASFTLKDPRRIDSYVQMSRDSVGDLALLSWKELSPFVAALIRLQSQFIGFLFLLVFVCVSFGVINTLLMSVFERTHEIGLVRAIGMTPAAVVSQIVMEAICLTAVGAVVGNLIAVGTVSLLSSSGVDISLFAAGVEYLGAGKVIYPLVVLQDWYLINVLVVMMGIGSGLYPAWRAVSLKPVEAITQGLR